MLAESLGCKAAQVSLVSGATSRQKRFLIGGIGPEELNAVAWPPVITAIANPSRPATRSNHDDQTIPTEMPIEPWSGPPPRAVVRVPGSKSLTNRALIVAAMADGPSVLTGALDCEDTRVMVEALRRLGIAVEHDPASAMIRVQGCGGCDPRADGRRWRWPIRARACGS